MTVKFSIDRHELVGAVATAARSSASKGIRPILANILIEAQDDKLRFVATDMESMSIVEIPASVDGCGKITASAKLLQELLSGLPNDMLMPVEVEELASGDLQFVAGKTKFKIKTMAHDDFPPVPNIDTEYTQINGKEFAQALKQASIAMNIEQGNPVQSAVCFDFITNNLVSTDGKRLMVRNIDVEMPESMKQHYIVPSKSINEICNLLDAEVCNIGTFKDQLVVKSESHTFITRLIEGKFPDFNRVMPKETKIACEFGKKAMTQVIKMLMPIAKKKSNLIRFDIKSSMISVSTDNADGEKASSEIECKSDGEIEMCFNGKFIQDFLNNANSDQILFCLNQIGYPGVLKSDNEMAKCVIMPMQG